MSLIASTWQKWTFFYYSTRDDTLCHKCCQFSIPLHCCTRWQPWSRAGPCSTVNNPEAEAWIYMPLWLICLQSFPLGQPFHQQLTAGIISSTWDIRPLKVVCLRFHLKTDNTETRPEAAYFGPFAVKYPSSRKHVALISFHVHDIFVTSFRFFNITTSYRMWS